MSIIQNRKNYSVSFNTTDLSVDKQYDNQHFKSYKSSFGKTISLDEKVIFIQNDSKRVSEALAHIPLTVAVEAKKVLVLGSASLVAKELFKHGCTIDLIFNNKNTYENIAEVIDEYSFFNRENKINTIFEKDLNKFLSECMTGYYDVVIIENKILDESLLLSKEFYEKIHNILSNTGIVVTCGFDPIDENETFNINLIAQDKFRFVIPFRFESINSPYMLQYAVFSSKKYHPTADLRLQCADMLEDLEYYNADLHRACFAIPNAVFDSYKKNCKL